MVDLISAEKARELTRKSLNAQYEKEKNMISTKIIEACDKCKSEIFLYEDISTVIETKLKHLGYHVENSYSQKDGVFIKISW